MAAYKKIQGNPIKPQGGKPPAGNPNGFVGTVKTVPNLKGGNMLVGHGKVNYFHKTVNPKINTGLANKIVEARGKHLA